MAKSASLLGLGGVAPAAVAATDGSVVSSEAERRMFTAGAAVRRLAPGDSLEALITEAGRRALVDAGVDAASVDRLYGYALVSEHLSPNGLFAVHAALGLARSAWVVPIATDFTNFMTGVALAREAVVAGAARYVLVACGASLSRHVDPTSGYAVSIGDAAGAALVGPSEEVGGRDVLVDALFDTESALREAAVITHGGARPGFAPPEFVLAPSLLPQLHDHGIARPVALVRALLEKHGIGAGQWTLVAHQPTRVLMGLWQEALRPAAFLETYDTHGNATVASVPATLYERRGEVKTPWMVLMSPGPGMHAVAVLVRCA